jgi:protein-disulfide isomerase
MSLRLEGARLPQDQMIRMMKRLSDSPGNRPGRTRREALGLMAAGVALLGAGSARAQNDEVLTEAAVLRDPDIPVLGNPDGDITIVEWFDYQCPYCRKIEPELRQVVQDDGKVRLVLKDWPILGDVSKVAARLALAAKYQDKFLAAHEAMIGVSSKLTEPRIKELLSTAGLDINRLNRDLQSNAKAIDAILARNDDQAMAFGFRGTPSFIVGKFRVPGILSMAEFEQVIADARKAKMN